MAVSTLVDRAIAMRAALADQTREVLQVVETPEAVAVAFRLSGRHVGPLTTKAGVLAPTPEVVTMTVMDVLALEGGRIAGITMVADELGLLMGLDAVALRPPSGPSEPVV